ncbi:MAG: thioredoxin domain-containing protein [Hydrogenothermaceae bacterium]
MERKPNRLINEKSPYLLAHAYNPVDWYPWCEEAFEKAKKEDKPIFLSIGYSSCHWCHVMEKESFEDEEIAKILNRYFISIKVDREERPDIDAVYMEVCLLFNGHGGWPLTVLMTPDKKPFFAGTYFPKESKPSRIGLKDLLLSVAKYWRENREDLIERSQKVVQYLNQENQKEIESIDKNIVDACYFDLKSRFDSSYGGFSVRPKFPSPHNLMFLMRYYYLKKEEESLSMVEKTLKNMRLGGVYDHIGYGFHRYSTDRQWILPHFEKMLYDQATLIMAYSEAYSLTKNQFYKDVVYEIVHYLERDMMSTSGGFYSSEDADSEGEEGKFYTWTKDEIYSMLGEDYDLFCNLFNIKEEGNYLEESTGELTGRNVLYIDEKVINRIGIQEEKLNEKIKIWREKLFKEREKRVKPFKDTKILTDWNSLLMVALSKAGKLLSEEKFVKLAEGIYRFIKDNMYKDGNLLHMYKDGVSEVEGMLDDYAFTVWGLLELYESVADTEILKFAVDIQKKADELMFDDKNGGYFISPHNRDLIANTKPVFDGAYPSGNSVMLNNLLKLYHISSNEEYYKKVEKTVKFFSSDIKRLPSYHSMFVIGLILYFYPVSEVVLAGDCKDKLKEINGRFLPNKVLLIKNNEYLQKLSPFLEIIPREKSCKIYVCKNFSCNLPTEDLNKALKLIED